MAKPAWFRWWHLAVSVVVAALGFAVYITYINVVVKIAWTDLALAEVRFEHNSESRNRVLPLVLPRENGSKYTILVVPSGRPSDPRVWTILNATPGGSVMMSPEYGQFELQCAYLERLRHEVDVDRAVETFLRARCHP